MTLFTKLFYLNFLLVTLIWTPAPPLRNVTNLGPVITDIESHLRVNHPYRDNDLITYAHEGTHGINSLLRNKYGCPAFYVLNNRAILLREPATTLSKIAAIVPPSLRGEVYNLYLIQMQTYWENQPTYVLDEFTAYVNGAEARKQLDIHDRQETVRYAIEFIVYSTCVPWASKSNDPQTREFLRWQIERVLKFTGSSEYLNLLKMSPDAENLRQYMKNYYGPTWTKKELGF